MKTKKAWDLKEGDIFKIPFPSEYEGQRLEVVEIVPCEFKHMTVVLCRRLWDKQLQQVHVAHWIGDLELVEPQ